MPAREPIAIVGMACRFPGGANDPSSLWKLLRDGVDAITEVPEQRWNASRFHHPNAGAPGRMVSRWGGFVSNVDMFDAAFFGLAPREAARIDPQHRWLAEVTWEAIEDAGIPPEQLAGSKTGVFIGISHADYPTLHRLDTLSIDGYVNIGGALSIAANRLSYLFNLRGPSLAVDTACSSSLVGLHLAAQSLWSGECDYTLVGGANALLSPEASIGFSQARMLSPRGRCRAFDAGADGYVRGEGAAAILLMPLRTAHALRLESRALLIATASNQDGRSSSLTVPSQEAQEEMIRQTLHTAQVDPRDVAYVEAHGTGTTVGDRIEVRALAAVLTKGRAPNEPLLLGSVKTNFGHLEPASGLAGLVKAVLVLEQRAVPPNLHFESPNPRLPMDRIIVPTTLTKLPSFDERTPHVAVNSFGFGGTNAHALLAPALALNPVLETIDEPCIFPLSARSRMALADYANAFAHFIAENTPPSFSLRNLCAAAALGKSHHSLRAALVADSFSSLQTQLQALRKSAGDLSSANAIPQIAFVFSGQGSQWWAMGRQLYHREKIIRDVWEQCDAICQDLGGPKLLDALLATEANSALGRTDIAQPALFALQMSLVELWRSWGIEPNVLIGHSVGEAAAAWAAGILELEAIMRVVISRSRWQSKMHGLGRMLAASISEEGARQWEKKFAGRIAIAAFNAPQQITLSGNASALDEIAAALQEAKAFCRFLPIDYAFHSVQMNPIEDGLRKDLAGIAGTASKALMISTVTGEPVQGAEVNADYWWRNVRQPVRFAAAIERALGDGCTVFVEIGAHPVMASALAEIMLAHESSTISVASLRRGENERSAMLHGLAALYRRGANVRWQAFYTRPARALRLPAYPWQRQRVWYESAEAARDLRSAPPHPLLGDRQRSPQPTWLNRLDTRLIPWLADHRLAGSAVMPAAAYLEMAAAAVREFLGESTIFLEDICFHHLLFLPEEQPVPICVRLDPAAASFQIFAALPDAPSAWKLHAQGLYRPGRLHIPPAADLELLRDSLNEECDPQKLYRALSEIGQVFGPAFQGMISLRAGGNQALSTIVDRAKRGSPDYLLFPPSLDSCFHSSAALEHDLRDDSRAVVASVRQVRLFQPLPEKAWSYLRIAERRASSYVVDLSIHDATGGVLAQVDGLTVRTIDSPSSPGSRQRKFYQFAWEPIPLSATGIADRAVSEVVIFSDRQGFGLSLGAALQEKQMSTTLVFADAKSHQSNGSGITVDLRRTDWAIEFWKTLAARGPLPERVIYLWSWDDDSPPAALSERHDCSTLLTLIQGRLAIPDEDPARWLVVTRNAQSIYDGESILPGAAMLWGFVRTVQTEQPQWRVSLVDYVDTFVPERFVDELLAPEIEPEVALREDTRWVRRLRQFEPRSSCVAARPPAYELHVGQEGRVDSLQFRGRSRPPPGRGEVEIEIAAAGLNFRDLMKVHGIYPLSEGELPSLGDEFSGRVTRVGGAVRMFRPGDRVMGFATAGGGFSSHLVVSAEALWKLPSNLNFAEAASIPVVFGTAYHALHTLARLRRDETVLIHAAAGGVGLAAAQLAQEIGARVLATAGNEEKRAFLRARGVELVMDSRTFDFADQILHHTNGRGVDVVLNSLAGAFQQKSLAICAPHGRFVEIGKRDLFENHALPLAAFQRSLSFFAFDLSGVLSSRGTEKRTLRRFLADQFDSGKLEPIPCTRFPASDAVSAFRLMQGAQHIGKIILDFDAKRAPEVSAEFWPSPDGTYVITGGLSGFGLATARWLVERGAMHLALVSRRGEPSAQDVPIIEEMRARGASVSALSLDVADPKALAAGLCRLKKTAPPVRGVFHAAMVLRDRPLAELTRDDLNSVIAPKVTGAWNLHTQTREMPLDCFVLFSSLSGIIGAPGQANYSAANAFLDALAHYRRALGLPALSVNWGWISDVGTVAGRPEMGRFFDGIGVRPLSSRDALSTLARLIVSPEPQVGVMDVDWNKLSRTNAKFGASPVFRDLAQVGQSNQIHDGAANEWREAVLRLRPEEQIAAVSDLVVAQLAATLGMAPSEIARADRSSGLDSLMAVELKVRIESHAGCELPMDLFNADITADQVAERLLKEMTKAEPIAKASIKPFPDQVETPGEVAAPLLRKESRPLAELIRLRKLECLTAGALMSWPDTLFEQANVSPASFFQRMNGARVSFDLVLQTPLGSVGIFMLPLTTTQVTPNESSLLPHLLDGMSQASECGARCVALTGLIPPATNYGALVQAACATRNDLAAVTTGHATTIASVILNLQALLREAERELAEESVLFYGIGSIGMGALRLMLDVLPHPAKLRLYDPYRSAEFFAELIGTLRHEHKYEGCIRAVGSGHRDSSAGVSAASVIVCATNVANALDVAELAPGTLVVDDSAPHCLNGPSALERFVRKQDILFTEGGFVRSGVPMPRVAHVPETIALGLPSELPQLLFAMLNPLGITGCILSALLSTTRPELSPTIGVITPNEARQHWTALDELGFSAAELNFEGTILQPELVAAFRERLGNGAAAELSISGRM
jgi:acyl transferase domain-containing protein/acyl carrier protein